MAFMATCFLTHYSEVSSRLASNSNIVICGLASAAFVSVSPMSNGIRVLFPQNVSHTSKFYGFQKSYVDLRLAIANSVITQLASYC